MKALDFLAATEGYDEEEIPNALKARRTDKATNPQSHAEEAVEAVDADNESFQDSPPESLYNSALSLTSISSQLPPPPESSTFESLHRFSDEETQLNPEPNSFSTITLGSEHNVAAEPDSEQVQQRIPKWFRIISLGVTAFIVAVVIGAVVGAWRRRA